MFYAVMTRPQAEDETERRIAKLGARTFYPHFPEWVPYKHLMKLARLPLLPRYFFVDPTEIGGRFDLILDTIGVSELVTGASEEPAIIPWKAIHSIMKWCDPLGAMMCSEDMELYIHGRARKIDALKLGDGVKFKPGSPLEGLIGAVSAIDIRGQITVELEKLGRVVTTAERCETSSQGTEKAEHPAPGELIGSPPSPPYRGVPTLPAT